MKKLLIWCIVYLLPTSYFCETNFCSGDIIFQNLQSGFGDGVQSSTNSEWAHVGIIVEEHNGLFVIEATFPGGVRIIPLNRFLKNCRYRYSVIRPTFLTSQQIHKMIQRAKLHLGKPYDKYFVIDNVEKIYCSELVYDAINYSTGEKILSTHPMDFKPAWDYWKKYFGEHPIPQGEPGISPENVYTMNDCEMVYHYNEKNSKKSEIFSILYE
jgi:hypothetical protein